MRPLLRHCGLALLALALWLPGCGTGLTGGSIPPGEIVPRARGIVIRADSSDTRVTGAVIRFQPDSAARATTGNGSTPPPPPDFGTGGTGGGAVVPVTSSEVPGTVKTVTNINGEFDVSDVPTGRVRVIISPPADSGLAVLSYLIDVAGDDLWSMVAAVPPAGLSTTGLTGIEVTPETLDLVAGASAQIEVRLLGGAPPSIVPTYLLRGDIGVVNNKGRFSATQPGQGSLRVLVGPYEKQLSVIVRAKT